MLISQRPSGKRKILDAFLLLLGVSFAVGAFMYPLYMLGTGRPVGEGEWITWSDSKIRFRGSTAPDAAALRDPVAMRAFGGGGSENSTGLSVESREMGTERHDHPPGVHPDANRVAPRLPQDSADRL